MRREKNQIGSYQQVLYGGNWREAIIPAPLPPNPPIRWDDRLSGEYERAAIAVTQVDTLFNSLAEKRVVAERHAHSEGATLHLSDQVTRSLLTRNEAVYSSRIEGTHSTVADVLKDERGEKPSSTKADVREVRNCVEAYEFAMDNPRRLITLDLLLEIHDKLMQHEPESMPGRLRDEQNAVTGDGKIAFVPPPHTELVSCMNDLLEFIENSSMRPIAIAALAHAQFETIHPFFDGNGRLGRILITLVLKYWGMTSGTPIPISRKFKENSADYYDRLQDVHESGDWERWLEYFATSIAAAAQENTQAIQNLISTFQNEQAHIREQAPTQQAKAIMRVYAEFVRTPVRTPAELSGLLVMGNDAVRNAVNWLANSNIVQPITTGAFSGRKFEYARYREALGG